MSDLNRVCMSGRLTADPVMSYTASQTAVCKFNLASNDKYTKQDGTVVDRTCFIGCVCWGKRGEALNKYFKKGAGIVLEGRLDFQTWQAQDGTKRSRIEINVENWSFPPGGQKPVDQQNQQREPGEDDDIPW